MKDEINELRKKLTEFIEYKEAVRIRNRIRLLAIDSYIPKYTDSEYIGFLKRHTVTTTVNHPQSTNHPHYYAMFSVCTQHIYADTIEELFDISLDIEKKKNHKK